jgi:hypothetical protein
MPPFLDNRPWFARRLPEQGSGYSATSWKGVVVVLAYSLIGLPMVGAAILPALLLSPNTPAVLLASLLIALGLIVAWAYGLMWIVRKKASRSEG